MQAVLRLLFMWSKTIIFKYVGATASVHLPAYVQYSILDYLTNTKYIVT